MYDILHSQWSALHVSLTALILAEPMWTLGKSQRMPPTSGSKVEIITKLRKYINGPEDSKQYGKQNCEK
jgi:hypothetical protein